ncbi:Predicted dithiol-disulfide oxidoreductase, DUF899 family [Tistlia consotensis]|uniref:Predicted dithiol-disulfide oxidoreductase, DUF899 family n=1 Tax=Tistlia consotensis USBA 355 TaxID=560819 RepID=A0A1Y6C8E8_9PROT|nr:thioredoxin family protein [Tistlia consotensis]SMF48224.1 Predicted dithiol-disulfide oxidoreductase, DUF899 family [Tistlia consotensis USBA 355]SNR81599.1 Predicted dithiol-disulfide oxidoreductase, DUF899 family [Tistlia consotensis]
MSARQPHETASREDWLAARKALLAEEKALSRQRDRVAALRRALPWVPVDKDYRFEAPEGPLGLTELFEGRSQLVVYHFMLTPGSDHICPGCSFLSDHVDAARQHFEQADLSFAAVSRAPLAQIEPVRKRMGWTFRWVSSFGSDFNVDFGVSFSEAEVAAGAKRYNYGSGTAWHDLPGASVFARGDDGRIYHSYSTYARGGDLLIGAFNWLDLVPKGRNEATTMSWVRLHDEYETSRDTGCCGSH